MRGSKSSRVIFRLSFFFFVGGGFEGLEIEQGDFSAGFLFFCVVGMDFWTLNLKLEI